MKRDIAYITANKITHIIKAIQPGQKEPSHEKRADITLRPDAKVGDDYPLCSVAELEARQKEGVPSQPSGAV